MMFAPFQFEKPRNEKERCQQFKVLKQLKNHLILWAFPVEFRQLTPLAVIPTKAINRQAHNK